MKYIFCISLLSFVLISWTASSWQYFYSYEGRFKILAPTELQEKVQTIESSVGTLEYHSFFYEDKNEDADNFVYLVSYVDYPNASLPADSTELIHTFFETTIETAVQSLTGELRYSDETSIDDFKGRIWRIDYNEGNAVMKTKAFVVHNRYYSVQVATTKNKSLNTAMDKFLDSFKLLL